MGHATIHSMSEPASKPDLTVVSVPKTLVGAAGIRAGLRVRHSDYGTGEIAGLTANGVQIIWDEKLTGTQVRLLEHDRVWVEHLELLQK